MWRRARFVLVPAALAASCTNDFDAPFRETGASSSSSSSSGAAEGGVDGDVTPSEGGTSSGTGKDGSPGACTFPADDYGDSFGGRPLTWFRLDESGGTYASLGTLSRSATRRGGVTRIARGALRAVNGAQHVGSGTIDFGVVLDEFGGGLHGTVALELWFRPASTSATQTLLSKLDPAGPTGYRITLAAGGALKFERFAAKTLTVDIGQADAGRWHHLVAQHASTPERLGFFLDGKPTPIADEDTNTFADNTQKAFVIGPFDGDVDEVATHNRLLLQADVDERLDAVTGRACRGGGSSVCFGPEARGQCAGGSAAFADACKAGEACVDAQCVPDTCPKSL